MESASLPPSRPFGHARTASEIDLIRDVRLNEPSQFVADRRTAIERDAAEVEEDVTQNPMSRRSALGEATIYRFIGGIDRVGMALFYGVLKTQGFQSIYWQTPCGRIHGLQSIENPTKVLPHVVLVSGLGSSSTDYILLALGKLKPYFRQVTVVELVGHAYSTEGVPARLEADTVTDSYRQILDSLSSEAKPVVLIGHSFGGRIALDYVTGSGRQLSMSDIADAAAASMSSSEVTLSPGLPMESTPNNQGQPASNRATSQQPSILGHHDSQSQPNPTASTLMHERVVALVLVAAMGAPFLPQDIKKVQFLYENCKHYRQAAAISRGAQGTTWTDPIMAGSTLMRMKKPCVKQLVASELFQKGVPVEELRSIRIPTLLLWGEKDGLVPGEHLQHYLANLPVTASIKLLPNMSHNSFAMGDGAATRAMLRFCYRVLAMEAPLGEENARKAAAALREGVGIGGPAAARWRALVPSPPPTTAAPVLPSEAAMDAIDHVTSISGAFEATESRSISPNAATTLVRHYRASSSGPVVFAVRGLTPTRPSRGGATADSSSDTRQHQEASPASRRKGGLLGLFQWFCGNHTEAGEEQQDAADGAGQAGEVVFGRPIHNAV
jgi:pimeloyl-ACP methyl ester carboxylesterase